MFRFSAHFLLRLQRYHEVSTHNALQNCRYQDTARLGDVLFHAWVLFKRKKKIQMQWTNQALLPQHRFLLSGCFLIVQLMQKER